jgi:hypothetical protein
MDAYTCWRAGFTGAPFAISCPARLFGSIHHILYCLHKLSTIVEKSQACLWIIGQKALKP